MVASGPARDLLLLMVRPERRQPSRRRHPFDLYWLWVFSTEKRWWQEARHRYLNHDDPWRPCCGSCGSEALDPHGFPWINCLQCGARWDGSEI
jgi:hypothetical protein